MPRAKGRLLPSSLSRNQAYSGLPLRAKVLYPLIMANADDQGRLIAEPQMLKWEVCPNVQEISSEDIPELLQAMSDQGLIRVFDGGGVRAAQLLLWWSDQSSMQWAYPSQFSPPEGWDDRLRFRRGNQVITINWPGKENGSQTKSLEDLQLDLSGSLEIAARKALGMAQVSNPGNPRPDVLPNAQVSNPGNASPDSLPEPDKGKGKGNVNEKSNDSVSAETGGSEPAGLSPPVSYSGWVERVSSAKNTRDAAARLADFLTTTKPGVQGGNGLAKARSEAASNIAGILADFRLEPRELLDELWNAVPKAKGDPLAYVRATLKRKEEGHGGGQRAAGTAAGGGEEWPGFVVEDDGPAEPEPES